jgi:hypothetical protein
MQMDIALEHQIKTMEREKEKKKNRATRMMIASKP